MATIKDLKDRATALSEKTQSNSISPSEVGGLFNDTVDYIATIEQNGSVLGIRKVYNSVEQMNSDSTAPTDSKGVALKRGQLCCIASADTDNGKVYAFENPGWQYVTTVDAQYVTRTEFDEKNAENEEKFTELKNAKEFYLEQGTIIYNTGLPADSTTRVRTAYFLSPQNVKITTTNDIAMYVYKYKHNGEFIADEVMYEVTSVVLDNFDRCYKISFKKGDGTEAITVDDVFPNVQITYEINKSIINICKPLLMDMKADMQIGYYATTLGEELSAFKRDTGRRSIKIENAQNGDTFIISSTSGSTGRIYAKVKNNIVIEISNEGTGGTGTYIVTKDDSFDTIVFNADYSKPFYLFKVDNVSIEDLQNSINENLAHIRNDLYGNNIEYKGSSWNVGFIVTNTGAPITTNPAIDEDYRYLEIPCKEGDIFDISVNNGGNARGWNFLDSERNVITQAAGSYSRLTMTITAPANSNSLLLNTRDTTDNSFVIYKISPIWERKNKRVLSGIKIAYLGDSAIDVGNREWPKWCSELLGAECQIFATGGYTYANQFTDESKTTYKTCLKLLVDSLIEFSTENNWIPDIIVPQIGGNDLWLVDKLGTLEAAFADFNYKTLEKDDTTYGGIRYNLQRLSEVFPNAHIIVGTVFQRRGNDASKIAVPIREVCAKLGVSVIDGNKYSGINAWEELTNPLYSDNPDSSNVGTREYPQYNWVEADGSVVSVDVKTESAVKKYGKYTYDGTHKTIKAEKHIAIFMASQIASYCGFNANFIDTDIVD